MNSYSLKLKYCFTQINPENFLLINCKIQEVLILSISHRLKVGTTYSIGLEIVFQHVLLFELLMPLILLLHVILQYLLCASIVSSYICLMFLFPSIALAALVYVYSSFNLESKLFLVCLLSVM